MCVNNDNAQKDGLVDIAGLSISDVLAALYNAVAPLRFGFADSLNGPKVMDADTAKQIISSNRSNYFEKLYGRILVVNLSEDTPNFDGRKFDKYHGNGSAAKIIKRLRATGDTNSEESINDHKSEFLENCHDALSAAAYFAYDYSGTRMLIGQTTVTTSELYKLVKEAVDDHLRFLFSK
jgi:hypothetical protein